MQHVITVERLENAWLVVGRKIEDAHSSGTVSFVTHHAYTDPELVMDRLREYLLITKPYEEIMHPDKAGLL